MPTDLAQQLASYWGINSPSMQGTNFPNYINDAYTSALANLLAYNRGNLNVFSPSTGMLPGAMNSTLTGQQSINSPSTTNLQGDMAYLQSVRNAANAGGYGSTEKAAKIKDIKKKKK